MALEDTINRDIQPHNPYPMKLSIALLVTVLVTTSSYAQYAHYKNDSAEYVIKIQKYRDMRTAGTIFTVIGTGLFVAGVAIMEENLWGSDQEFQNGTVIFLIGAVSLGAGIPLWIVGAHQHKKYSEKLKGLSLNLQVRTEYRGLSLRYRF